MATPPTILAMVCAWCGEAFVPALEGEVRVKLGKRTVEGEAAARVCIPCGTALGLTRGGTDGASTHLPGQA